MGNPQLTTLVVALRSSRVLWYHHDQLGSTRLLTDYSGTTQATNSFDPYGNLAASTNPGQVTNPFRFAGQYTDAESGLYYLRARYYDPSTGQFITRDPALAVTDQPYAYVESNPLNFSDPSGRCIEDLCIVEGIVVIAVVTLIISVAANSQQPRRSSSAQSDPLEGASLENAWNNLNAIGSGFKALGAACGEMWASAYAIDKIDEGLTGEQLAQKGQQLMGERHSSGGRARWLEWWRQLTLQQRQAYNKAGGKKPAQGVN